MLKLHSDCKSLQFGPLLSVHAVVVALAVRLDCNHRYHHNNGEERGRLKCIIKLQREELQGLPSGFDLMYLALADRNMQVRFGLKVVWES